MEISKLKQTLLNSNGCDTLVPKRNVGELYKLLKPHIHSLSLEDFTNLVGSKKSLEKTFFKPKPYHNNIVWNKRYGKIQLQEYVIKKITIAHQ